MVTECHSDTLFGHLNHYVIIFLLVKINLMLHILYVWLCMLIPCFLARDLITLLCLHGLFGSMFATRFTAFPQLCLVVSPAFVAGKHFLLKSDTVEIDLENAQQA